MKPEHIKMIDPDEPVIFTAPGENGKMRHLLGYVMGYAQDGALAIILVCDALCLDETVILPRPIMVVRCTNVERGVVMAGDGRGNAAGLTLLSKKGEGEGDEE